MITGNRDYFGLYNRLGETMNKQVFDRRINDDWIDYFDKPTQVKFIDPLEPMTENGAPHFCSGIAYKDKIICGCCGGIFQLDELEWMQVYQDWIDISEAIVGEGTYDIT